MRTSSSLFARSPLSSSMPSTSAKYFSPALLFSRSSASFSRRSTSSSSRSVEDVRPRCSARRAERNASAPSPAAPPPRALRSFRMFDTKFASVSLIRGAAGLPQPAPSGFGDESGWTWLARDTASWRFLTDMSISCMTALKRSAKCLPWIIRRRLDRAQQSFTTALALRLVSSMLHITVTGMGVAHSGPILTISSRMGIIRRHLLLRSVHCSACPLAFGTMSPTRLICAIPPTAAW
mmetsp:Transcript_30828/g.98436  ORF Transcript_30828/g.98436 Transcript_30828/m.98436 type:complete len:236 (-) Transcript_30828:284-991(-)